MLSCSFLFQKSRRLSQFDHGDIYGPCDRRMMISGDSNERAGPLRVDATQDVGTSTSVSLTGIIPLN